MVTLRRGSWYPVCLSAIPAILATPTYLFPLSKSSLVCSSWRIYFCNVSLRAINSVRSSWSVLTVTNISFCWASTLFWKKKMTLYWNKVVVHLSAFRADSPWGIHFPLLACGFSRVGLYLPTQPALAGPLVRPPTLDYSLESRQTLREPLPSYNHIIIQVSLRVGGMPYLVAIKRTWPCTPWLSLSNTLFLLRPWQRSAPPATGLSQPWLKSTLPHQPLSASDIRVLLGGHLWSANYVSNVCERQHNRKHSLQLSESKETFPWKSPVR